MVIYAYDNDLHVFFLIMFCQKLMNSISHFPFPFGCSICSCLSWCSLSGRLHLVNLGRSQTSLKMMERPGTSCHQLAKIKFTGMRWASAACSSVSHCIHCSLNYMIIYIIYILYILYDLHAGLWMLWMSWMSSYWRYGCLQMFYCMIWISRSLTDSTFHFVILLDVHD